MPSKTERKPDVIAAFAQGMTWREVAAACDVSLQTIWRWADADPEFAKAIKEAGSDADAEVEAATFANATDPDPSHNTLRMFWLKSRKPNVYHDRQTQQHTGGITIDVIYQNSPLSPESSSGTD